MSKIIKCDICGRELGNVEYKLKKRSWISMIHTSDYELLDICEGCVKALKEMRTDRGEEE